MTASRSPMPSVRGVYRWPSPVEGLRRAIDVLVLWQSRGRERRHLASLDGRAMADLGLDRADAAREAAKPFWRV